MTDKKITDLTAATTLVDADIAPVVTDIATSATTKKITWANIKAALWAAIHAATSKTAPVDADELPLLDSEGSYGVNRLLLSNLKKYGSLNETKTLLTSGSGTFTPRAGTVMMEVELVGGGGGGGGCTGSASNCGLGSGGTGGGYVKKLYTSIAANYSYGVGAAGQGQSNDVGTDGGDTTFGALTGSGGKGGGVLAPGTTLTVVYGATAVGGAAAGGDINIPGEPSNPGIRLSGSTGASGNGSNSSLGHGGVGRGANAAGTAGVGYGSGGGGSFQQGSASARAGGNGAPGVIIIREYGV